MRIKQALLFALCVILTACGTTEQETAQQPTDTLAPLVSLTPRLTATPIASRTPLPTFTFTPSESPIPPTATQTYTPSPVPPTIGIIMSLETVNVRQGPGTSFSAFVALDAGTQIEVLGYDETGNWMNVRLVDGREGWVSARLVRVEPTSTPFPTLTPSPDLTALALGTPFPTAIFGGGTITATPPRSVVSPTPDAPTDQPTETAISPATDAPITDEAPTEIDPFATATPGMAQGTPVINASSVFLTLTALSSGILPTTTPADTLNAGIATPTLDASSTGGETIPAPTPATSSNANATVQQGVDVLAYCDDRNYRTPAPTNLAAGSTIDVFWGWYAKTEEQVRQHLDAAQYEVQLNGKRIENLNLYATNIRKEGDGNYHIYWFYRSDPLPAGQHKITYQVSWKSAITDGYATFGPGTPRTTETGTCTFTVY